MPTTDTDPSERKIVVDASRQFSVRHPEPSTDSGPVAQQMGSRRARVSATYSRDRSSSSVVARSTGSEESKAALDGTRSALTLARSCSRTPGP